MSTLQEQVQSEFDAFFRGHPRLRKNQKNVNILCAYTSLALAEAYGQTQDSLEFIPLPLPPPPPQPAVAIPPPTEDTSQIQLLPRQSGESSFHQLIRSSEAHAISNVAANATARAVRYKNGVQVEAPVEVVAAADRQERLDQAAKQNLEGISQAARARLRARGRGY